MTGKPVQPSSGGALRLDKWLWYARFFKTRSLASQICTAGKVRVDGAVVGKAHFVIRPGHVLTFVQGGHVRVVKVLAVADRRGPAPEAQALYEDLAPPAADTAMPRGGPLLRPAGFGRPTKRDRRAMDRARGRDYE